MREIKANFPTQYGSNLACELCQVAICCQEHILSCVRLKQHVDIPSDICYSDIFENTDNDNDILKLRTNHLSKRKIMSE